MQKKACPKRFRRWVVVMSIGFTSLRGTQVGAIRKYLRGRHFPIVFNEGFYIVHRLHPFQIYETCPYAMN
jgi:hypothetical protein